MQKTGKYTHKQLKTLRPFTATRVLFNYSARLDQSTGINTTVIEKSEHSHTNRCNKTNREGMRCQSRLVCRGPHSPRKMCN